MTFLYDLRTQCGRGARSHSLARRWPLSMDLLKPRLQSVEYPETPASHTHLMNKITVSLTPLDGRCAVCRLSPSESIPDWAASAPWLALVRASDELSIVCDQDLVPIEVPQERDWRRLRVTGTLDFHLTGILAALAAPLAEAKIPLFAISSFNTDYLLVKADDWERALQALRSAGHAIDSTPLAPGCVSAINPLPKPDR